MATLVVAVWMNVVAPVVRAEGAVQSGAAGVRDHRLTKVGAGVFLGSYGLAAFIEFISFLCAGSASQGGGPDLSPTKCQPRHSSTIPLLIPLAGPFLALTNSDVRADRGMVFYSSVSAIGQIAGAGLMVYSLLRPHYRVAPLGVNAFVLPGAAGSRGVTVVGRF